MKHWHPQKEQTVHAPDDILELTADMRIGNEEMYIPRTSARETLRTVWGYTKLAGIAVALNQGHALFLENFAARSDWQAVGRCDITGFISKGPKETDVESIARVYTNENNYKPQHGEMDVRITHTGTDSFDECRKILLTKGFNLWSLELTHGKAIPGVIGMDGKTSGGRNSGTRVEGTFNDIPGSLKLLDEFNRDSKNIEQEWNGISFTPAWYAAKTENLKYSASVWMGGQVENIRAGYSHAIDGTIRFLQSTKPSEPKQL